MISLKGFWKITKPFWTSNEKWWAFSLIITCIVLNVIQTYISVQLNEWNNDFFNALQRFNEQALIHSIVKFFILFVILVLAFGYNSYFLGLLTIRWRRWQTHYLINHWLMDQRYYFLQLSHLIDNPDQRISEDIDLLTSTSASLFFMFVSSLFTLISFGIILWNLSGSFSFTVHGTLLTIPGYLLWCSFLFTAVATWINHLIGRKLTALNYNQQKFNADFRYRLIKLRESSEQIALLKGEISESSTLQKVFQPIFDNFLTLNITEKNLGFFQTGYNSVTYIFGLLMTIPRFFAEKLSIGYVMQTSQAFSAFTGSLAIIINSYTAIAEWRAVVFRLLEFETQIEACQSKQNLHLNYHDKKSFDFQNLQLLLPNGKVLLEGLNFSFAPHASVLIKAKPGTGKSVFLRATAGIWPYMAGKIFIPHATRLFLPQRPYLPIDTIANILSYPYSSQQFTEQELTDALAQVDLFRLSKQLYTADNWDKKLSPGEQQILQFAKALLQKPEWLFLDEASSAIDIQTEATLYRLLKSKLPLTTVISTGHRPSLIELHDIVIDLNT
ncbi:MAG: ABC transporter ATP-binding protein/permease [Gammaproteobacteria bacterium]|nr:ABC transporter ATP-binding protein/permease [Gammaproteobacteria bacterium]